MVQPFDNQESEKTMKTILRIAGSVCVLFAVIGLSLSEAQTVSSSIGILPARKTVTITYDVRVKNPVSVTQVGTQGSVSGSNFTTILTDDPDTGAPNDSTKTSVVSEPPLPIQLASFAGHEETAGGVLLRWTTVSEINNYGFFVHRRIQNQPAFSELPNSFIPGHGTTNGPQQYQYRDMSATAAQWFYRLKQVDLDGSVHMTDPIQVNILNVQARAAPHEFSLSQNYPNPWNPSTSIRYALPYTSFVTLTVYNTLGQLVAQLVNEQQQAGYHDVVFQGDGLAGGVYFYRLEAGSYTSVRKLIFLK